MKNRFICLFFVCVPLLILVSGCQKQSYCIDSAALNYQGPQNCSYSKVVWFLLNTDSINIKYPDMFPITFHLDGVTLTDSILDSAAIIPGAICDGKLLPPAYYVIDSLPDAQPHNWVANSSKYGLVFNGTVQAGANACIAVKLY